MRSEIWTRDWKQLWAEDFRWLFSTGSCHQETWSMAFPPPGEDIKKFMVDLIGDVHK